MGVQPARVAGVDLNLDEFNLSAPTDLARQDICVQLEAGADISSAFWPSLSDELPSMFNDEDKALLRKVFNPCLSDRREEGSRFVPPDTSFAYVQKLRALVKEEEAVQRRRMEHFFDKLFSQQCPGPLFPSSWASSVEISHGEAAGRQGAQLSARPHYVAQAHVLEEALQSALPVFDKSTEDGTRFRVYRLGSLEVRTTQEHDGLEAVGAVFSLSSTEPRQSEASVRDDEKIVKATEYVERSGEEHRCYVVLETDRNNAVVVEESADGQIRQENNPQGLEDRNSLARVVRLADCSSLQKTMTDLAGCQGGIFCWASGDIAESGFRTIEN